MNFLNVNEAIFWMLYMPLFDSYYNEQDGEIIFGHIMQTHYKNYPPEERYTHIISFMENLYQMHKPHTCNSILFTAIVKFLWLIKFMRSK